MTTPFSVDRKRVVVVGAARSGVAAAELLVRRGAIVTLTDTRPQIDDAGRLRALGVSLALGGHEGARLASADLIVLSPGVSPRQPEVAAAHAAGVPVIGELELASRWLRGKIVAITGTKGKSTTTTLTGRMLDAAGYRVLVGGNIGLALSAQVDDSTDDTIHVVEASSFQLETTDTFHPWIAVLLNFSPDHL
ncbi:MAG TPA: Mur ligase family protein, partial [Vicinamibacterales bacterium]|nr:Mur ligase family protein [Vicinamibacterales bacterium]